MEKTSEEIKEIFLKELNSRNIRKLSRKIKRIDYRESIRRVENNDPFLPEMQKFIYESSRIILGRKPIGGESNIIESLWREELGKLILLHSENKQLI